MQGKVIIIEGSIGAGKSNFAQELSSALTDISGKPCKILIEPSTEDEIGGPNPYLSDYYSNPSRWAFAMQCHLLQERLRMHISAQYYVMAGEGHAVIDRSFYGDVAFLELQKRDGHLDNREYYTYHRLYEIMTSFVKLPTICVRLLVSSDVAQDRIKRRAEEISGRRCEEVINIGYLERLNEEIEFVCFHLSQGGVEIINEHWNQNRGSMEDRQEAIRALARHIHKLPISTRPKELHLRRIS